MLHGAGDDDLHKLASSGQWSVNAKPPWEGEAPAEPNLREYTVTELVLGGPRRLQASR